MTPTLDELEQLYQAATPGEWLFSSQPPADYDPSYTLDIGDLVVDDRPFYPTAPKSNDARFIAAIHNAFPALLALARDGERIRKLETAILWHFRGEYREDLMQDIYVMRGSQDSDLPYAELLWDVLARNGKAKPDAKEE